MSTERHIIQDVATYAGTWWEFRQGYERIPAIQATVLHEGQVLLADAWGHANVETGTAVTKDHLFRIASHSKTFAAAAVMTLVQAGTVRLDDAVHQWLPEFPADHALGRATIGELLSHSTGVIRDTTNGDFWQLFRDFPEWDDLAADTIAHGAILDRNDRFKYSNVGFGMIGKVVEKASGKSFAAYCRDVLLAPLGLHNTGAEFDPAREADYATGYTGLGYHDTRLPIAHVDTKDLAAATGFYSTATEVATFFSALLTGSSVLNSDNAALIRRERWASISPVNNYAYGLLGATVGGRNIQGHSGGFPGYITFTGVDRSTKTTVSVLTNCVDGKAPTYAAAFFQLLNLAEGKAAGADAVEARDNADLQKFCGRFGQLFGVTDIVALGGRLFDISPTDLDPVPGAAVLSVTGENTLRFEKAMGFASPGETVTYDFRDNGTVRSVRLAGSETAYPLAEFQASLRPLSKVSYETPARP